MTQPEAPTFARGLAIYQRGDLAAAEAILSNITGRQSNFDTLWLRGIIALRTGRAAQAAGLIQAAVALQPGVPEAHSTLAHALLLMGQAEPALAQCDRAIELRPDCVEAHINRGHALRGLNRPGDALASFDLAIALRPDEADAYVNRGTILRELRRHDEALSSYDTAIALRPGFAEAHNNRGNALEDLGRYEEALHAFDAALRSRPDNPSTHATRGKVLHDLHRHEAALASFARAIALRPDYADAHWNLSLCQLAMGDFRSGWRTYEWRWKASAGLTRPELPGPLWLGDFPIDGKTIIVRAEQGLGDSLQFCRYVPLLAARANLVLQVQPLLTRLLATLDGAPRVIAPGDPLPAFDAWIPMMSLPLAFGTTVETIPAAIPYLRADPELSVFWKNRVSALPGRKIGLVWAGAPRPEIPRANAIDQRRSMPQAAFAPLASIPGLCLISLQKGEACKSAPPAGMALRDWTNELNDFADTAALIDALDLVISVDTSVAHLAGALGKPVWVLNRYDQCWRWLRDRTDSPWYPTARLFRQPEPGDWSSVIRDVAALLRR
jgi:tetratricopeptide (TPR) repeat protein